MHRNKFANSKLKTNSRTGHSKKKLLRFPCDHCDYKTNIKQNFLRHFEAKHLPRNPYSNKCSKCEKSFSRPESLKSHSKLCGVSKKVKHQLRRLSCHHCTYKCDLKSSIICHIQAKHLPWDPNLNKCSNCGKNYSDRSNFLKHSKLCHPSEDVKYTLIRFSCDHCNFKSNFKANLACHVQAKHLPRDHNANKCSKCGKNYSKKSGLLRHLKICGLTKDDKYSMFRFSCEHCEYKSNRKYQLARHILAKHLPREPVNMKKMKNKLPARR